MHIALNILFGLILLSSCTKRAYLFTSFHEPADKGLRMLYSTNGYQWQEIDSILLKPSVGVQKVLRDPSMVLGPDGTYHLVWTSSWRGDKGFGYAASSDLTNWTEPRMIPVMEHEPTTVNVWAPELFYDDVSQQFIIIWASCIPGRFPNGQEADSNNHRMYVTTTKDFESFTETKLFLDPGFSVIDAVIVKRKQEDYVLVLKDNTRPERNLKIAFSNHPLGPWQNISPAITTQFTEGPTVVNTGKEWLIYFDDYGNKKYGTLSTHDFIGFKKPKKSITIPEGHKHGTIVPVKKKELEALLDGFRKK